MAVAGPGCVCAGLELLVSPLQVFLGCRGWGVHFDPQTVTERRLLKCYFICRVQKKATQHRRKGVMLIAHNNNK